MLQNHWIDHIFLKQCKKKRDNLNYHFHLMARKTTYNDCE